MSVKNNTNIANLPLSTMLLYSFANIGSNTIDMTFDTYTTMLYVDHKLITVPILFGIAVFIGRVVDALANPIVGWLSDTHFGPRGRRIPFMIKGSIPLIAFYILLFYPTLKGNIPNFIYATICCSGMLFFFTYVCAPYLALLPDIARTNDDRVKVSTYQSIFAILGIVVAFIVAGLIIDSYMNGGHGLRSYSYMGVIIGLVCFITLCITAFSIKEKPILKENRITLDFWGSVLPSFKNRLFLLYVLSISSFYIGFKVLQTSINFVCKYMFGKSEAFGSYFGMGGMIGVWLISTPMVFFFQKKFGKRKVFSIALLIISVVSFLQGFIGVIPKSIALYYYLGLIFCFGVPFAALLVLYNAILGDIIDIDEKNTGYRREAMYYGMEGLFTKTARGIGTVMIMLLFQVFGSPSPTNYTALIVSGPICGIFAFIGFILFSKYPIQD